MRNRIHREEGQATTELALMMCVIFAVFFWALQAEIILGGMHQAAYASFNSARILVTSHHHSKDPFNDGMKKILTGKVFTQSEAGPASLQETQRNPGTKYGTVDGVEVDLPRFASLPYARGLLNFDLQIPTHLGPDEWDQQVYPDQVRDQETGMGPCWETDNNLRDAGSC